MSSEEEEIQSLFSDLSSRCRIIVEEVHFFEQRLADLRKSKEVELRGLTNAVQSEVKCLAKIRDDQSRTQEQRLHMLRSTNVTFYEAVWTTAKHSHGVTGFLKRFYWEENESKRPNKKKGAAVDIVARGGTEWIKLSTVSETRLLFELARQGWERNNDDVDDDVDDDDDEKRPSEDDKDVSSDLDCLSSDIDEDISILKAAKELVRASRATRVNFRHPHVRLVLPKISRGIVDRIDELLNDIERLGLAVQTAESATGEYTQGPQTMDQAIHRMMVDEFANLTQKVNVDCTILLAIISDLTNSHVEKQPWLHTAAKRQIEMEEESNMLPTLLFPVMGARELVCTREAAVRMQEIVDTIGTRTEKARAQALLPAIPVGCVTPECLDASKAGDTREARIKAFSDLSIHAIPTDWQLPIQIVSRPTSLTANLPVVAEKIKDDLSELNRSVFFYGWCNDVTTLTSNRTIAKRIQNVIEDSMSPGRNDISGPRLWLCPTARSLRAKDKNREAGARENHFEQ